MTMTTFTPKAANTVQAQTIASIKHVNGILQYVLADGSQIAVDSTRTAKAAYVPVVGDYLVAQGNKPTVWKASDFTANYS